jgi:hypothetical protein
MILKAFVRRHGKKTEKVTGWILDRIKADNCG